MAKPDWGAIQKEFLADHAISGISPKEWCEARGYNYSTARRYIKHPSAQNAQTTAQEKVRSAQSKRSAKQLVANDNLPEDTTYLEWLARQSPDRQDQVLGVERGRMFRAGELQLGDMFTDKGEWITLAQLKSL